MHCLKPASIVCLTLGVLLLIIGAIVLALSDDSSSQLTAGGVLLGCGIISIMIGIIMCVRLPSSEKGRCNCFTMRSKNDADTRIPMEVTLHEKIYFGKSDVSKLQQPEQTSMETHTERNRNIQKSEEFNESTNARRPTVSTLPFRDSAVVTVFAQQEIHQQDVHQPEVLQQPEVGHSEHTRQTMYTAPQKSRRVSSSALPPGLRLQPGETVVNVTKIMHAPRAPVVVTDSSRHHVTPEVPMLVTRQHPQHVLHAPGQTQPVLLPSQQPPFVVTGAQSNELMRQSVQYDVPQEPRFRQLKQTSVVSEGATSHAYPPRHGLETGGAPRDQLTANQEKEQIARQLELALPPLPPSYDETVYQEIAPRNQHI